jgi:DNA-binding SARP family transcriptional activator/tetratricopeptide (TPR) repeat protein
VVEVTVEFHLLGPVEAWADGQVLVLGHARQRCVLTALLVDANRLVSADQLIERVWAHRMPRNPRAALAGYLSRLRRLLAPISDARILRRPGGYVLTVEPTAVDLYRFRDLVARARAAGQSEDAATSYAQAFALWRGEPFATLDTPWINDIRAGLQRERHNAELDRTDVALTRGLHAALVPALSARVCAYPLDERLTGQLMLALYRCGRQADALQHYHRLRLRLADELGTDPTPPVQRLYERILRSDPALAGPPSTVDHSAAAAASSRPGPAQAAVREPAAVPPPAQLPADVPDFTGRTDQLRSLDALLSADGAARTVVISAVSGTAGVGKTALAVRWAHRVADRFPDGQLYLNLRGYDPDQPISPGNALAGILTALGVPGQDIPLELDDRAARYRTEISGRRMLIVLDNAGGVEQVRPLLPGTSTCVTMVTSRDSMAGLVALHGARRLDLDALPVTDAVALLHRLIGRRAETEPEATATLAHQCDRLPLALRLAAELAVSRPTSTIAALVAELCDLQRRLDLLAAGDDPRAAVQGVFSWSYQHLPAEIGRAFQLLGLHPGPDYDTHAAAALIGTTREEAQRRLDILVRAHLVHRTGSGRYSMHDLLRAYANRLANSESREDDRKTALTRLFDHYLAAAATAMQALRPDKQHRQDSGPLPAPQFADTRLALAWLDAERAALVAACAHTASHGWPAHATALAATLYRYLVIGGYYPDAISINTHARHAARRTGDQADEAHALANLGNLHGRQGRYTEAADHHQQALTLFRAAGDLSGQARALNNLGILHWRPGRYTQAADHYRQALNLYRQIGHQVGQAHALTSLGNAYWRQGHYQQAADHHQQALALYRATGHQVGQGAAMAGLGAVYGRQGRHQQACDHLQQAGILFREIGHRVGEAIALTNLGDVYLHQGIPEQAAHQYQQALELFRETGDHVGEATALNGIGETTRAQPEQARALHHAALTLAIRTGDRYEQARAHAGLTHSYHATGDLDQARHHQQQALSLYGDLDVPEAETFRRTCRNWSGSELVRGSRAR